MQEDNEQLLQQFFSEAAAQQIEDNGFTEQVRRRLPLRVNWFTRLWTLGCILVFAALFVVFHGRELLAVQLEVWVRTLATLPMESVTINLGMVAAVVFGLLFVGASEAISSEIVRK